jgi:signal transduction histidine kinase
MTSKTAWLRLAQLQVAITSGVVLSFLASTAASSLISRSIERDMSDIVGNAMPSVQALSTARTNLHHVEDAADAYLRSSGLAIRALREPVIGYQRHLDAAVETYFSLPPFPHEAELANGVRDALAQLDRAVDRAIAPEGGPGSAHVDELLVDLHASVDRLDEEFDGVSHFNAAQGERLGLAVTRARESAGWIAWTLDGISVALAGLATGLAVVGLRRRVRLLEDASASAEKRASESDQRSLEFERFASHVAHDVLSPLGGVSLALDLARRQVGGDEAVQRSLARGSAALGRVRCIVDGLLEFARAGAKPAAAKVDAAKILDGVVDGIRPDAEVCAISLSREPMPACVVACSAGVLTSMASNLVRNAIKHMHDSKERRVVMRTTLRGEVFRVEVHDTGPGVPQEIASTIFEPYVRADHSLPGIGLGLATVHRLAIAHGGRAGYEPRDGGGSVFWFELPVAPGDEKARTAEITLRPAST